MMHKWAVRRDSLDRLRLDSLDRQEVVIEAEECFVRDGALIFTDSGGTDVMFAPGRWVEVRRLSP